MTVTELVAILAGLFVGYLLVGKFIKGTRKNSTASEDESVSANACENSSYSHDTQETYSEENGNAKNRSMRFFSCPTCNQKIRVKLPLPDGIGRCSKCATRFHIHIDDEGNLYITETMGGTNQSDINSAIKSIKDCFAILGLADNSSPDEIKSAYRKKMREYHPDKVANLGIKLKEIADGETKRINSAYTMLRNNGFL
jgi:DnaJ-domain-containing protein 1